MTTDYKLILKNTAGAKVAEITDHLALAYTKRVNAPGLASFRLNGGHAAVALLADKYQVEIWRRNQTLGIDWYADFYGLYRARDSYFTDRDTFVASCPGQMCILGWQTIAYAANVADRSAFTSDPGETIMKQMVKYNATSSGTTGDGRKRNATSGGAVNGCTVSNQADGAAGNTLDWYCMMDNLLESLQKLARVAGGDFDLIKTGAAAWEFRWYIGQRGTDRSTTVTFSLSYGNMARPRYLYDRREEKTVAIVGGGGEDSNRTFVVRTGDSYNVATNAIEMFVDARNEGTVTAALNTKGDQKLDQWLARQSFDYDVLQTSASAYGLHYCVGGDIGDLVKGVYLDIEATQKIVAVTVSSDADKVEQVGVELADV